MVAKRLNYAVTHHCDLDEFGWCVVSKSMLKLITVNLPYDGVAHFWDDSSQWLKIEN